VTGFVDLMWRYCIDYTNRHDLTVCDEIMSPGYTLHMGGHHLAGRDDHYKPAVRAQYRQFPTLGLVVHALVTDGDRLAMRFSEHGASDRHDGALAAWSGIGVYRWNGVELTENWVEQDYFARRVQLERREPGALRPPGLDPWRVVPAPADARTEAVVRGWLDRSAWLTDDAIRLDDTRSGASDQPRFDVHDVHVDDLFTAGAEAAFHVTIAGEYRGGFSGIAPAGQVERHHAAGIVEVDALRAAVAGGEVISDRLGLWKRLGAAT